MLARPSNLFKSESDSKSRSLVLMIPALSCIISRRSLTTFAGFSPPSRLSGASVSATPFVDFRLVYAREVPHLLGRFRGLLASDSTEHD
ncbi:MAG: hypothetical protein Ct9H300mP30_3730 [Methanobacteriota archaeon]|nr:MAG: hypothetical protein Ct9H300mP30_3730 [Euryarchaeota archaeon]